MRRPIRGITKNIGNIDWRTKKVDQISHKIRIGADKHLAGRPIGRWTV